MRRFLRKLHPFLKAPVDGKGLETLLDLNDQFAAQGRRLRLAELDDCCQEILHLTDLHDAFERYITIDDAVRSLL